MARLLHASSERVWPVVLSEGVAAADIAGQVSYLQLPSSSHLRDSLDDTPHATVLLEAAVSMAFSALTTLRARVIIHDTIVWPPLVRAAKVLGLKQVLSLRPRRDLEEYLADDLCPVKDMDLIFVPDSIERHPKMHAQLLAAGIAPTWTGPLYRQPRTTANKVRAEIGVRIDQKLIVITGGGGSGEDAREFCVQALDALNQVAAFECVVVVVLGPLSSSIVNVPAGFPHELRVGRTYDDVPALLACSDLIMCRGGYNTVHEAVSTGAPVIARPAARVIDDQFSRVNGFQDEGLCETVAADSPRDALSRQIERLLRQPRREPTPMVNVEAYGDLANKIVQLATEEHEPGYVYDFSDTHI